MTNQEKRLIVVLLIVSVVIIGGLMLWSNSKKKAERANADPTENTVKVDEYAQILEDGSKINVSNQLLKTKTLDGLEFTNIQLREKGGLSTLSADVTNKTGSKTAMKTVKIEVLAKDGTTIVTMRGTIEPIEAGGKVQFGASASSDLANAYDFRISNV